ncbi:MAG: hypothetical protein CMQ83_01210 [Gammaproteobacteria bacterium]|nr:hypothetical protein [Gammaproteobacteria bacterium]|tara:strand:- start:26704 stop:28095 length:1392 start_codon:yes stop_codon:yes gene_type:complete
MKLKNNMFILKNIKFIYLIFLSLTILFGRSFTGLYIFGFRIGELLIALCLIVSIVFLFIPIKYLKNNSGIANFYIHKLIIVSFFLIVPLTNGSFFDPYTFRSSSYVWTFAFLLISNIFLSSSKYDNQFFRLIPYFLPALYILSTIKFPDFLITFFVNYSDKFDFVKASDLLLVFIATNFIVRKVYKITKTDFSYFIFSSAVYLPYLLFKSKGAFFPAVLFVLFNLIFYLKFINNNKGRSVIIFLIASLMFLASSFHIYGNFNFTKMGQDGFENVSITNTEDVVQNLSKLVDEKNTSQIFASFYILEGRIYSQEQMADWRLQIWQDVVRDLFWNANYSTDSKGTVIRQQTNFRSDIFYKGFGYNDILPAMKFSERSGTDGTNQNPHNFLIYALGRGGLIQFILVCMFHLSIIIYFYQRDKNFEILLFILPVLMTSFFDASMESVRFPLIYYSLLAMISKMDVDK